MKKLNLLKSKEFHKMSDTKMKNVVGGYGLPEVTIYKCMDAWKINMLISCTSDDAFKRVTCRMVDCSNVGTCTYVPFDYTYTPRCIY